MWKSLACCALGCLFACGDDERECIDVECIGLPAPIPLVDEAGSPVGARGELRNPRAPQQSFPFDCSAPWPESKCQSNVVVTGNDVYSPEDAVQIRFEQTDASFSPWQSVELEFTKKNNADFSGPGCPCTYYTATASSVIVPVTARRALTGPAE